jgi:hypothetical protein
MTTPRELDQELESDAYIETYLTIDVSPFGSTHDAHVQAERQRALRLQAEQEAQEEMARAARAAFALQCEEQRAERAWRLRVVSIVDAVARSYAPGPFRNTLEDVPAALLRHGLLHVDTDGRQNGFLIVAWLLRRSWEGCFHPDPRINERVYQTALELTQQIFQEARERRQQEASVASVVQGPGLSRVA